jgi:VWFA-related protein
MVLLFGVVVLALAQDRPTFRVKVDMVVLSFQITDNKGKYVNNLKPKDFRILEDGIPQKLSTFGEGSKAPLQIAEDGSIRVITVPAEAAPKTEMKNSTDAFVGTNVFVLFDTSNYMYRGFVFAQDAIADFVRSLDTADKIALYSYSRDLSRVATLTPDRGQVLRAVRTTVAGDEAALYNTLLLTLRDASQYKGRKVVVVFSNGPDNSSVIPPEDVAELAQSAGISVYMISTQQAKLEPVSTAVFERMTAATGGKAYFAKNWKDEKRAFASIRDDLAHLYSLSYYPRANPNRGWRAITVKLVGDAYKKYHVRTRTGYRLAPTRFASDTASAESRPEATPESQP